MGSYYSEHVGRCSLSVSHPKTFCQAGFSKLGAKVSPTAAFNCLVAHRAVLQREGLSSSVCLVVGLATPASTTKVYEECYEERAEWCD